MTRLTEARETRESTGGVERARLATIARLYYLDELRQSEIASLVGLSRSQVRSLQRWAEPPLEESSVDWPAVPAH